jgi:DNA-binding transcriptional ArsR family regulator
MRSVGPAILLSWLRSAGEPTRLRLLALCAEAALSVSDLAQTLKQSEPRVSRHLRILSEAGLIARVRQGQWVHYRIAESAEAASFVRGLLGQLDRGDALLAADRSTARAALAPDIGAPAGASESRLGRALAALVAGGDFASPSAAVLVVGVAHPELLEIAAAAGRRCTAIAYTRRAAQGARAFAERRGFACRVLQAEAGGEAQLARAGESFDAVLLDHPAGGASLARLLEQARRVLSAQGRLWVFERYEALESRERVVEHPLARLRRLLGDAGLTCERLSPVESDGEHVLAALARPAAQPGSAVRSSA